MEYIKLIRRANLKKIADHLGGQRALAEKLGKNPNQIWQLIGADTTSEHARGIGEKLAEEFEEKLNLNKKDLDKPLMDEIEKNNMLKSHYQGMYNTVALFKKYVDMAYGLRHLKNDAKSLIFEEMIEDQKKYILTSDLSLLIKEIIDDETKLMAAWDILHNLEFAKKIFFIINQE